MHPMYIVFLLAGMGFDIESSNCLRDDALANLHREGGAYIMSSCVRVEELPFSLDCGGLES
jgi:hypothetical protein